MTRQNSVSFRLDSGNYESWGPYRPASKDFSALLTHACDSLAVLLAWFPVQSLVRWMDRTECHSSQPVAQQQALLLLQSPSSAKQRGLDSWQGSMSSIRPQASALRRTRQRLQQCGVASSPDCFPSEDGRTWRFQQRTPIGAVPFVCVV